MAKGNFDTLDGDDIDIESDEVVQLKAGDEEGTTVIELDDGREVQVVATQLEIAAELGLDPLEYVSPDEIDVSLEDFAEDDSIKEEE